MAAMALIVLAADPAAANQYIVTNLGTLPGGTFSRAASINIHGQVVGVANNSAGYERGFFWSNGSFQTIVPDGSGNTANNEALRSYATGINDNGQVVGYRDRYYAAGGYMTDRAYVWTPGGVPTNIPNFSAAAQFRNRAHAINNDGVVTGHSTGQGGATTWQPFKWTANTGTVWMGSLTGNTLSNAYAYGINAGGSICGYGQTSPNNEVRAFRSNGSSLVNLGGFPNPLIFEPPLQTYAYDINDANTVVGQWQLNFNTFRAFSKTQNGAYVDLGLLPGSNQQQDSAVAYAINNVGEIVGDVEVGNANHRASIYKNERGVSAWIDLNTRIPSNSGWVLEFATDINDKGQIVGYGKLNGQTRGFILTPAATISGNLDLQDFVGDASGLNAVFEIRSSINGQLLDTQFALLGQNGAYSFTTTAIGPNRYVRAKFWHWLSKSSAPMSISASNLTVNLSLVNGDVNTDNEVNIGDYAQISYSFGASIGEPRWSTAADLNGDFTVDIGDYAILSANFGMVGDD